VLSRRPPGGEHLLAQNQQLRVDVVVRSVQLTVASSAEAADARTGVFRRLFRFQGALRAWRRHSAASGNVRPLVPWCSCSGTRRARRGGGTI
jgi:hypothetical protein